MEKNKPENAQTLFLFLVTRTNMSIYGFIFMLGIQNRKNESKMAMAKRQRKEKVHENRTKENPRTQVRTSGETNSSPGQPNLQRAGSSWGGDKTYKKRKPRWTEASSFGWVHPHTSFLCLLNKTLSCNGAVTLARRFKCLLR